MTATGVGRLAIVSAAVLFPEQRLFFAFFQWLLRHHARDLTAMEHIARTSGLAWTIARPPRLTGSRDAGFIAVRDGLLVGSLVDQGRPFRLCSRADRDPNFETRARAARTRRRSAQALMV